MSIGKKVTRITRGALDQISKRLEDIERTIEEQSQARVDAETEFRDAMSPTTPRNRPGRSAPSASAPPASASPSKTSEPLTEIGAHYKALGLEEGTEFAIVRRTYMDLIQKCDPMRFPEESEERAKAEKIKARLDEAYKALLKRFDTTADRFGELQL